MSEKGLVVEFTLPSKRKAAEARPAPASDSVSRIARLLALAHKWEGMVRRGEVSGYAEIAKRMGLSRARVTQICTLCLLPPTLQRAILDRRACYSERECHRASTSALWDTETFTRG